MSARDGAARALACAALLGLAGTIVGIATDYTSQINDANGAQNVRLDALERRTSATTAASTTTTMSAPDGSCLYNDQTCAELDRVTRQLNGSCGGRGYTISIVVGASSQRVSGACKAQP